MVELEKGYSPDPIRDAVWQLVGSKLRGNMLDAGCGEGGWTRRLLSANPSRMICVDVSDDRTTQLPQVEFHFADLSYDRLPLSDGELDWTFALEVLEHLSNPRHFIKEAARCLKPDGKLVITTPSNDSLTARLSFLFRGYFPAFSQQSYEGTGHITPITEIDLKRMAHEAGFSKTKCYYLLPGRVPKLSSNYQAAFPALTGKLWTDTLIAILTK